MLPELRKGDLYNRRWGTVVFGFGFIAGVVEVYS